MSYGRGRSKQPVPHVCIPSFLTRTCPYPFCSSMCSQSLRLLWQKETRKEKAIPVVLSLLLEVFLGKGAGKDKAEELCWNSSRITLPMSGYFASSSSCLWHRSVSWSGLSLILCSRVSSLPPSLPPCFPLASSPALGARSLQREQLFEATRRALAWVVVCRRLRDAAR